jgi:DUF4097 and DUF4098 domain-containing protein YvlB
MKRLSILCALAGLSLVVGACGINQTIRVADGEVLDSGRSTVNGSVIIGAGCEVHGSCRTVNGRVTVGKGSQVGGLQTVNGSIKLSETVSVDGDLETVNGSIDLAEHVTVTGGVETVNGSLAIGPGGSVTEDIGTVNGKIHVTRSEIGGSVVTTNGKVSLLDHTQVAGDVVVKGKPPRNGEPLEILITGNSVVQGDIIVRHSKRKVQVFLTEGGRVEGEIHDAEVVKE